MRPRHWELLRKATGKEFVPPHEDEDLQLGGLLSLNLHEFNTDVEEICDQATKEEKIEVRISALRRRRASSPGENGLFVEFEAFRTPERGSEPSSRVAAMASGSYAIDATRGHRTMPGAVACVDGVVAAMASRRWRRGDGVARHAVDAAPSRGRGARHAATPSTRPPESLRAARERSRDTGVSRRCPSTTTS